MNRVTKEEFYGTIYSGRLNVHPQIVNDTYPYTCEWKYLDYAKHGQVFGKSVGIGDAYGTHEYYVT